MTLMYYESDNLKELSDKELIKRHYKISKIESDAQVKSTPRHLMEQIRQMYQLYDDEMNRRLDNDLMDEDFVEEFYEYLEDKEDVKPWK